jgi:hypothetical protein
MITLKEILEFGDGSVNLFSESPLKVKKWDVDVLEPLGENYLFTIAVKEKGKLIGKFDMKYEIYQYPVGEYTIECFVDGDFTVAFLQYIIDKNNWCDLYKICQDALHLGLIRKIILEYYLEKYSGILSFRHQKTHFL